MPVSVPPNAYDAANQLTQWGTATLTHDANGNMLSSGTDGYTWDARNQLVSTLSGASFQYDALGRRVASTLGPTTTNYLYDGVNVVQEIQNATPANLLAGLRVDEIFTRAGTANFLTDALGSTVALADATGTIQTQYTYEPFGNTTVSGQVNANPYQYTGREDDGTGLYFYRARYYSPTVQRFISEDPIGMGGGINVYAYVGNNPVNFVDPLGLKPRRDKPPKREPPPPPPPPDKPPEPPKPPRDPCRDLNVGSSAAGLGGLGLMGVGGSVAAAPVPGAQAIGGGIAFAGFALALVGGAGQLLYAIFC